MVSQQALGKGYDTQIFERTMQFFHVDSISCMKQTGFGA